MEVPQKFETSIEMALGSSVQNIVTESEDNANNLVRFLKDNNLGRATFLPISTLSITSCPSLLDVELDEVFEEVSSIEDEPVGPEVELITLQPDKLIRAVKVNK